MKILAIVTALPDTSPGQRFRIEQWARYLERDGFQFTFAPFVDQRLAEVLYAPGQHMQKASLMLAALGRRLSTVLGAGRYDAVFLYREASLIGPGLIERLLAARRIPLIYDFDDPIWLPYKSPTNGFFSKLKCPKKTISICRLADHVITGNRLLGEWALQHNPNVTVAPSTIDLEQYPIRSEPCGNNDTVTLGWTGSHSTLPFLDLIVDALNELAETHPFRLVVVAHSEDVQIPGARFDVVGRRWTAEREALDLDDVDIGLGPFPDSGWTPWRCHGKVLQYMALGIPCVVSRLGILPDYIDDGHNGMLAGESKEWVAKLKRLIDEVTLRRQLGSAGRKTIEERYSASVWAPRIAEIFRSAGAVAKVS
jgi:glycosyltransferase involved in cell wall biosynthesis